MPIGVKTPQLNSSENNCDDVISLEHQLKELWSLYTKCLDEQGSNDEARSLRERYFNVYRRYRRNKKWRESIIS